MAWNPLDFAKAEWEIFKNSKTVKAVIATEGAAVVLFVKGVFDGTQELSVSAVQGWLAFQVAMIFVLLLRHTFAGIEAKADGLVDPKLVAATEEAIQQRAIDLLKDRGHSSAATTLRLAFTEEKKGVA